MGSTDIGLFIIIHGIKHRPMVNKTQQFSLKASGQIHAPAALPPVYTAHESGQISGSATQPLKYINFSYLRDIKSKFLVYEVRSKTRCILRRNM